MVKDEAYLFSMRHSAAHILAAAVLELYPGTKLGIGPVVENGFYYDFDTEHRFTPQDLNKIEKRMKKIISRGDDFIREELSIADAEKVFKKYKQTYKLELIHDLKKKGTTKVKEEESFDIKPGAKKVSIYKTGEFFDLCQGPHVKNSKDIGIFKLDRIAGAYWRGDEKNPQLQRIYGLAFATQQGLDEYLHMREEAEKRDHRKLGKELDLFTFSDVIGKGLPLWTEKGATIRRLLERFVIDEEIKRGYKHVLTPDIAKIDLYEKSGHYPYYKDSMYAPIDIDDEKFMLRPMTCPHHYELYLSKPKSYRDLPLRLAEAAKLYRYEQSGELTGLIRVRCFCLADAHIICADAKQAEDEVRGALDLIGYMAKSFGLKMGEDYWYRLSLGDRTNTKKYVKDDKSWNEAEGLLRNALKKEKCKFVEAEDEASFYGPKIDVQMKNVNGKEDTAFTVQYDFVMPKRFNLTYKDKDGKDKLAVVVHRSSIGAYERSIAFLIERFAGAFPLWLAPVQVAFIPVGEKHVKACEKIETLFKVEGIRTEIYDMNETVGYKIRQAEKQKIPYSIVIGDDEVKSKKLSVRMRGSKELKKQTSAAFIKQLLKEIENRA